MKESCKDRVKPAYNSRLQDLKDCWKAYNTGKQVGEFSEDSFHEYGLSFDYVPKGTFTDQRIGFFRYQISYGGPSEEFRYFTRLECKRNRLSFEVYKVEFWFLDWFDGAKVTTTSGKNFDFLVELFEFFQECGSVESEYKKAMED